MDATMQATIGTSASEIQRALEQSARQLGDRMQQSIQQAVKTAGAPAAPR